MKAWAKHQPDLQKVLKALKAQKNSEQWKKDDGRFIPLPTTWLNGARWEDEVDGKTEVVDRSAISNELAKKNKHFWYLSKEEQTELINLHIKENA